jgi:hypothetical protein
MLKSKIFKTDGYYEWDDISNLLDKDFRNSHVKDFFYWLLNNVLFIDNGVTPTFHEINLREIHESLTYDDESIIDNANHIKIINAIIDNVKVNLDDTIMLKVNW